MQAEAAVADRSAVAGAFRVYVGTYAKYNAGNLYGAWLDLADYEDAEALEDAARALHRDEEDPELMIQDYEGLPRDLVGESRIDPRAFEIAALRTPLERETAIEYISRVDGDASVETALEASVGVFESRREAAEEWYASTGAIEQIKDSTLLAAIDWDVVANDLECGAHIFVESRARRVFHFIRGC